MKNEKEPETELKWNQHVEDKEWKSKMRFKHKINMDNISYHRFTKDD